MADGDGGGSDGGGSDGGGSDGGGSDSGGYGGGSDGGSSDSGGFGGGSSDGDSSGGYGGADGSSSGSGSSDAGASSDAGNSSDSGFSGGSTDSASTDSASTDNGGGDVSSASSVGDDSSDDGDPASSLPGGSSVASSDAASAPSEGTSAPTGSDDQPAGDGANAADSATPAAPASDAGTGEDDLAGVTTASSEPAAASDGFTVSTTALGDVNTTFGGLVGDGQGLLSGLGSLNLSPSVFGGIGSPVASAAQDLTGGQLSALGSTFGLLGSVNDNIGLSNAAYQDADQQVSASLGGFTAPVSTTSPYGSLDTSAFTSPYGSLPDASIFGTTPGLPTTPSLPTFANPTLDEATAINTLNAQDQQTPTSLADDQAMQDQLVAHEAAKTHVYTDTAGHPTVGIGFNLDRSGARDALSAVGADYDSVRAGTQDLTDAQVTQLAHTDTQHAVDVARNYFSGFDSLDPARQRALVDMSFNLDNKINQFTGLHQALVNGDYDAAANHISSSLFARQTGVRGTDLTNQMRNGGQ